MSKNVNTPAGATVNSKGWSVDQLLAHAKQNPNAILDVTHLTPMKLIQFRLADPTSALNQRRDNGKLFIACEAGAMKGAILAGFAEAIHEHDLQRVIDGGIGSSVGTVAVCGIATRNPSSGANAQRYLGDKAPYPDTSPDMRYISWSRFFTGGNLLEGQVLKDVLDTHAPLDGEFAFPTYAVMSRTDGDTFRAELTSLHDKSVAERHMARFETMRVPGFMDKETEKDKNWDGAGAAGLPIEQCQELGATHVWALRVEPPKAQAQMSMVKRTLEQAMGWAVGKVEGNMMRMTQLMTRLGWDGDMIVRWVKRNEGKADLTANPPHNVHITGMERSTVIAVTRDTKVLAENRVAGFEHMAHELHQHLGLETEYQPAGWGHEIREDLGLDPDAEIDSAAIHEQVIRSNMPTFDPSDPAHRNDPRYQARMDKVMKDMLSGGITQEQPAADWRSQRWGNDGLGLAG